MSPIRCVKVIFTFLAVVFIFFIFNTNIVIAEEKNNEMYFNINDITKSSVYVDASVSVHIPSGKGFAYLTLPFSRTADIKYQIESSISNDYLVGFSRQGGTYLIIQILLNELSSELTIHIKDAVFEYEKNLLYEDESSICIPFEKAINELNFIYTPDLTLKIDKLYLDGLDFISSTPPTNNSKEKIKIFDLRMLANSDVYLNFKTNTGYGKYFYFGVLGVLIGVMTGLVVNSVQNKKTKIATLVIFGIILIGLIISFFTYILPNQFFKESTYLLAFTTASGIAISAITTLLLKK